MGTLNLGSICCITTLINPNSSSSSSSWHPNNSSFKPLNFSASPQPIVTLRLSSSHHSTPRFPKFCIASSEYDQSGLPLESQPNTPFIVAEEEDTTSIDLQLPRRSLLAKFTCNSCGERSERLINPLAYKRGTVFVQCAGCLRHHKLVDNLGLVVEYDFREDTNTEQSDDQI